MENSGLSGTIMGREIRLKYRITHTYIQRIHYNLKLPFALSNKIELFQRR